MSEEAAFLRAITAEPADDTSRLVYADWLDEHGSAARAEFVRVQIELSRMKPPLVVRPYEILVMTDPGPEEARGLRAPRPPLFLGRSKDHVARLLFPLPAPQLVRGDIIDVTGPQQGERVAGTLVRDAGITAPDTARVVAWAEVTTECDHYPDRERLDALRRRERVLLVNFPAAPYWGLPRSLDATHPHRSVPTDGAAIGCTGRGVRPLRLNFRRGFAECFRGEGADWVRHAPGLRELQPITRAELTPLPEIVQAQDIVLFPSDPENNTLSLDEVWRGAELGLHEEFVLSALRLRYPGVTFSEAP